VRGPAGVLYLSNKMAISLSRQISFRFLLFIFFFFFLLF
jgi:hypothetical protein